MHFNVLLAWNLKGIESCGKGYPSPSRRWETSHRKMRRFSSLKLFWGVSHGKTQSPEVYHAYLQIVLIRLHFWFFMSLCCLSAFTRNFIIKRINKWKFKKRKPLWLAKQKAAQWAPLQCKCSGPRHRPWRGLSSALIQWLLS